MIETIKDWIALGIVTVVIGLILISWVIGALKAAKEVTTDQIGNFIFATFIVGLFLTIIWSFFRVFVFITRI